MGEKVRADVTIVGAGIAGLWTAKELLDNGYSVTMVEKGRYIAGGATTRNEGWLHSGAYHAAIVDDDQTAMRVIEKIQLGNRAIQKFAPESISKAKTYALLGKGDMAARAINRWQESGIGNQYIQDARYLREADGIDTQQATEGIYAVEDKSVDTNVLCKKLTGHIIEHGGRIFTNANFEPQDERNADIVIDGKKVHSLESEQFVLAAGSGIKELSKKVGQKDLPMHFFKAHLLIFPRITQNNYFSIDSYGVNFMNHKSASIAGMNLDSTEVSEPNYTVIPQRARLIYEAVSRLTPQIQDYEDRIQGIACIKPGIKWVGMPGRPGIDGEIFELAEGYIGALSGKMTEAPYLAREIVSLVDSRSLTRHQSQAKEVGKRPVVASRPIDIWLSKNLVV